jgi:antitoxin VapB
VVFGGPLLNGISLRTLVKRIKKAETTGRPEFMRRLVAVRRRERSLTLTKLSKEILFGRRTLPYIYVYAIGIYIKSLRGSMQHKAKIFMNNRSQAVRLPKEFQFKTREVFIRKEGSDVVLSTRPFDWSSYLAEGPVASATFMEGIEELPVQERER